MKYLLQKYTLKYTECLISNHKASFNCVNLYKEDISN